MPLTYPEPVWIDNNQALDHYCREWSALNAIALDTEFIRTDTFYPQPGLIQVGTTSQVFLIDPLTINQWQPFKDLLEHPGTVKILHACSEDLEVFKLLTGTVPSSLFDTQLAAAFANLGFSLGYQSLLKQLLGIDLPKDETRSNWRQRPLTEAQIRYASLDVTHLLEVHEQLLKRLSGQPQKDWLLEDCAALTRNILPADPENAYREVKRAWQLRPQQLGVLQALCIFREGEARRADVPRNRVIPKGSLWPLACYQPDNRNALKVIQDMKPPVIRSYGDQILAIIKNSSKLPKKQLPAPLPSPLPKSAREYGKAIKKVLTKQAHTLDLPVELLLPGKVTTPILRTWLTTGQFALPESITGWRREIIGQPLINHLVQLDQKASQ